QAFAIPNRADRVEITPEMAEYMPHQRGASFPALDLGLMRQALRRVFSLTASERQSLTDSANQYMRARYSYAATAPAAIEAIRKGWENQPARPQPVEDNAAPTVAPKSSAPAPASGAFSIHWCGLQLFYGKIPTANREICLELIRRGHPLSLAPGNGPFHI